uniref:SGNH hydrolase-type esterase domain-containing protein n=1 Tax=Magallana gigas TaxID=29159 RepID=A0A8W8HVW5_MAGGI
MSVLFVGDSQLKYLHHVQLEDNTAVRCTSGFRVEQMWALFSGIVKDHDIIVLHAGTNNVPREEPSTTLHRYQHLLKIIWTSNPTARIIASAVLPRDYNVFEGARNNVGYIDGCNRRAQEINDGLKMIASRSTQLEFCPHPSFGVDRRTANRRLLSRDGLHLTRRGIQQLHDDIQVLVSRIRSSMCVRAPSYQPESVCEDREDPIPTDYRDALLRTTQPTVIPEFTADLDDEIIWPSLPRKV